MAGTENIFCSKKPSGFSSFSRISLEESQISIKLPYTDTAKHLRQQVSECYTETHLRKKLLRSKEISKANPKVKALPSSNSPQQALWKFEATFERVARRALIQELLWTLIVGKGGEQRKTTCYCLFWLRNAFNLHGVGTLHSKTPQLPEIMHSQQQQSLQRENATFKYVIFTPTQHKNSPKGSWKLPPMLAIPHPKSMGSRQGYWYSWGKPKLGTSTNFTWAITAFLSKIVTALGGVPEQEEPQASHTLFEGEQTLMHLTQQGPAIWAPKNYSSVSTGMITDLTTGIPLL